VAAFNESSFEDIFNPSAELKTFNEMPLMYKRQQQTVYGIIDRVIKSENSITIIDYKSHQLSDDENIQDVASQFSKQLGYYRDGINKLWPGHAVKTGILFTHHKEMVWLE
jgi:ATP-dependent helicase/nuclease subunit A